MLSGLTGESASGFPVECIGVEETVAEKVLSFLRRTAEARAGRNRAEYDDRPVRHLYDASTFERDYLQFIDELVFGEPVSFAEARSVFIDLAERLISAIPQTNPIVA